MLVQTLPTAQVTPALTDSFSRGHDPFAHACKARPLTIVGWTSLSVSLSLSSLAICIGCGARSGWVTCVNGIHPAPDIHEHFTIHKGYGTLRISSRIFRCVDLMRSYVTCGSSLVCVSSFPSMVIGMRTCS